MMAQARLAKVMGQLNAEPVHSMGQRFGGQVAVVTGAAGGIGFAIAQRLAMEGATAVLLDMSNDALQGAVKKLSEQGYKAKGYAVDVTSETSVNQTFMDIFRDFARVDILVQSAGITGKTGIKTHEVPFDNFCKVQSVNMSGIFLCCKAVLPYMLNSKYGRIVNIASIAGKEGNAGMLSYSTSKGAVIAATKSMGKEYAETGITVNCIAPAVVRTAMVDAMPDTQVKYMTDKIPMKRCGKLEEIAALVGYIASDEASFVTGFCFDATGGRATY